MEKKLGQNPAFPCDHELNFNANGYAAEAQDGMSKRLYIAKGYADCAYKWAEDMSIDACMEILGLDADVEWNYTTHFAALVAKLQYMLADELLKQEHNG